MHLTNYAINKDSDNFVCNESEQHMDVGHKRSLTAVLELIEESEEKASKEQIWTNIKDIILKTLLTGMPHMAHIFKTSKPEDFENNMCFHILGMDIFLDKKCKPYLLEVNHTPSFATDSPLDY